MKLTHSSVYLSLALSITLFTTSCKKEKEDPIQETPVKEAPEFNIEKLNNPTDGQILVSPYTGNDPGSGKLVIMDKNGNILKWQKTAAQALNFEKWTISGKTRYTYTIHDINGFHIPGIGYIPGYDVIADSNLNELKRIYLVPNNGRSATDPNVVDAHDFVLISDDHYIVESYYLKTVSNIPDSLKPASQVNVVAAVIQEINNGQVTWEWNSTDYPELYASSIEGNHFDDSVKVQDYCHLNSIFIDPRDNNLILSFRNLNEVIKVDRQSGSIMWRLGGPFSDFAMTPDQKFLRQHHATLVDNNQKLLIFDDGEAAERPMTRIVEFELNEASKSITSFKATPVPTGIFSGYMGSVQKRGDTYFVGGGSSGYMAEFNYNTGEILFQVRQKENSYRAFKY